MARTRLIKPSFFKNDKLGECSPLARIVFASLWCMADREGKVEDRPKIIKLDAIPYDDANINNLLDELSHGGFIDRYEVSGVMVIQIINFLKHQRPHPSEPKTLLPNKPNEINVLTKPHDEAINPHEKKCGIAPSSFSLSPFNPSLEAEAKTPEKKLLGKKEVPTECSEEILPARWHDIGEKRGVPDEQIYKSWKKFKDSRSSPWQLADWTAWINRERFKGEVLEAAE